MSENKRTPLYAEHVKLGARMVPFAGWEMPLLYRGIIPEHLYTREKVSIFDICHMGEFEISGPTAEADLERLLTQSVKTILEGACAYGYLLADDGGVLDDLICYRFGKLTAGRFGQDKFWLVVNASTAAADAQWIKRHLSAKTVFRDLSSETAKLDIQGPGAREEMESALSVKLPELGYYHFCPLELGGVECVLSRTGYTGEFGYELYLPAGAAADFWKKLLEPGKIMPAGLGARDTLRVEMGFPLYGHELTEKFTPAGVACGKKFIDLNKSFIGKEAVLRAREDNSAGQLVGLRLEGRMAARPEDVIFEGESEAPCGKPRGSLLRRSKASGCEGWIFARLGGASGEAWAELRRSHHNDEPAVAEAMAGRLAIHPCGKPQGTLAKARKVGKVTSGLFAPSLNVAVALGFVERQFAVVGQKLSVKTRGKNLVVEVVKLPFYKQGTARGLSI